MITLKDSIEIKTIPERIECKNLFPTSIICPKGSFIIELKGESCIFTATLSLRFGWLISKFAKNRLESLRQHIVKEGQNCTFSEVSTEEAMKQTMQQSKRR